MNLFRYIFSIALCIYIACSAFAQQLEIPITNDTLESQEIVHTGYSVSYNQSWCLPNWVAYELTAEEVAGTVIRSGAFVPDPLVVGASAVSNDYKYTGWDRGHMAPAADMRWSKEVMAESFYLLMCVRRTGI